MTRPLPAALCAALLLTLPAPLFAQETPAPTAKTPAEPAVVLPAITVAEVAPRLLRDRVIASGLVAAVERVHVQPLVGRGCGRASRRCG